jgi:pyruvate dehydrogenase E2 component (dihydrolipoamide acetyltransferase)
MATTIIMPKLGNTVESSVIISWKVKPGERIDKDSVLCEIETDKATMDVPAGVEGTVLALLHKEGDDVPVLEPIAVIGEPGETWADAQTPSAPNAARQGAVPEPTSEAQKSPAEASTMPQDGAVRAASVSSAASGVDKHASPRARQAMSRLGVNLDAIAQGSGPDGRIIERDVIAASLEASSPRAAEPKAARSAADAAASKVEAPIAAPAAAAMAAPEVEAPAAAITPPTSGSSDILGPYTDTPIKGIRKIIAERMMRSLQSSAQLSFNASAPAERLLALRARLKNSDPALGLSGVTVGDLVGFAAVRVLARYPRINAHVVDSTIRSYAHVHLGLAVDTPRGLMVPVVKNADAMSLRQFSEESKRLAKGCLEGTITPDELSGATFTVTNLGAFGIESFTPILNSPETGILGVDCIVPRPTAESVMAHAATPTFEMRIGFSLTVDHRVVDGADAARFLKDLSDFIANIDIAVLV